MVDLAPILRFKISSEVSLEKIFKISLPPITSISPEGDEAIELKLLPVGTLIDAPALLLLVKAVVVTADVILDKLDSPVPDDILSMLPEDLIPERKRLAPSSEVGLDLSIARLFFRKPSQTIMDDDSSGMDEDEKPQIKVEEEVKEEMVMEKPIVLVQPEEAEAEDLGVDRAGTKVWLVKIPKFVSERWSKITEPGVELGKIRIYKKQVKDHRRGGGVPLVKLVIPEAIAAVGEEDDDIPIPKNYNLTITNMAPKNEYVFTENSQGKAVEVS